MMPKVHKTMISHGSSEPGIIRLTVRANDRELEAKLTPTETAELAHRLLITLFQAGYEINAKRRP